MAQRLIILDDTSPSINYVGPWFLDQGSLDATGNFGPAYNHTLHGIKANGSFSFSFQGTYIEVWGTNNQINASGIIDPSYTCAVDNVGFSTKATAQDCNNQIMCSTTLNDGPHTLTVNVTSLTGQPFWLDDLHYAPSSGVSEVNAGTVVEQTDPALVYGSGWEALEIDAEMTSVKGANVSFNFTGVGLSWYGRIPTNYPHNSSSATYSIDGGNPTPFQLAGLSASSNVELFNQIFFTTPPLTPGQHNLFVVNGGNNQTTPLNVDYIVLTNSAPSSTVSASTSSSATPSSVHTGNSTLSTGSRTPAGAIAGGVVGGVAVIIAAVIAVLLVRRRQKTRQRRSDIPAVDPFRSPPVEQVPLQRELQREPIAVAPLAYENNSEDQSAQSPPEYTPPEYTKLNPLRSS